MKKPNKPKYYAFWKWGKYILTFVIYLFAAIIDLLDNLWIFIPLVLGVILYYFFEPAKYFDFFRSIETYNSKLYEYEEALKVERQEEFNKMELERVKASKVNDNIEHYLREQRIKRENSKWWQFWV